MTAFRDWLNTVFGSDGGRAMQMILALLVVVGLLLTLAWLFRRVFGTGLAGAKGGRLAVIDAAHVDGRRRLVLLRRDDVEHLVMIGGPNDLLVESRILRGAPVYGAHPAQPAARPTPRPPVAEPTRAVAAEEPAPRPIAAARPAIGAIGAALAGAGAFVRARTARGGEDRSAPAAAPAADRRNADIAFDAPLGTPDEPVVEPVPAAAPARAEAPSLPTAAPVPPRRPIVPPQPFLARSEPTPPEPTPAVEVAPPPQPVRFEAPVQPPRPQPAPQPRPMPTSRPQPAAPVPPPVVAAPIVTAPIVHAALEDPQERIGAELERALAGFGFVDEPEPVRPPQTPVVAAEPAPIDIDLQSELALVVTEQLRPEPVLPAAAKIEPIFADEPAPHHDEPAIVRPVSPAPVSSATVSPVAPIDTLDFEQSFGEALFARHDEPEDMTPPVAVPAQPTAPTAAPDVVPEPAAAKTPVDELEEEMARLLSEISGPMRR